jgi:ribose 5-phosphate isomerase B
LSNSDIDLQEDKQVRIAIGNDHAALQMKQEIKAYLQELGHEVIDYGTNSPESCDYPEFGEKVGRAVAAQEADCGVLICGTGVGISIAANKVKGVRAAVCSDTTTAHLVKEHNNANIIAFGARIVGVELAKDIVKSYLDAEFMGGRHQKRIDQIAAIENAAEV